MAAFDGLYIADNTTPVLATTVARKLEQGWAAQAGSKGGALDVVASAANSRLTCKPGHYLVGLSAQVQSEDISGTSLGSSGDVKIAVYKDQALVAHMAQHMDLEAAVRALNVSILGVVVVGTAEAGQLEVFISGNVDITVKNAQFFAIRIPS